MCGRPHLHRSLQTDDMPLQEIDVSSVDSEFIALTAEVVKSISHRVYYILNFF